MAGVSSAARVASIALLAEWGIDGNWVAADGWDSEGYDEFPRNPNTSRESKLLDPINKRAVRVRHEWPEGFPIEQFTKLRGGEGR